jgi:hypothetical protein
MGKWAEVSGKVCGERAAPHFPRNPGTARILESSHLLFEVHPHRRIEKRRLSLQYGMYLIRVAWTNMQVALQQYLAIVVNKCEARTMAAEMEKASEIHTIWLYFRRNRLG